ncbi:hypothetical protein JL09_g6588 [Pichia kudriavzevii]|uniref:Uncharacterized protein n=1 Tax=Pichia kudriavzevii TaxID=4909 RepID=A0A099NP28_PICKU|nr:hypothetical protein JL09_g6588 [Pichia kudriavzevii]
MAICVYICWFRACVCVTTKGLTMDFAVDEPFLTF